MSHQAYFDYLGELQDEIWEAWPQGSTDLRAIIFKLTASPYHFWLENQAALAQISSPKASAEKGDVLTPNVRGPPASCTSPSKADVSNLANKAQEIREKARTAIKTYSETGEKQWSHAALADLWALKADWAKGAGSLYKALDDIPDDLLCLWNDKHEVFM